MLIDGIQMINHTVAVCVTVCISAAQKRSCYRRGLEQRCVIVVILAVFFRRGAGLLSTTSIAPHKIPGKQVFLNYYFLNTF